MTRIAPVRIVSKTKNKLFRQACCRMILHIFSQLQSRQRRIPILMAFTARRRRGLIRDMLRGYVDCSLRWLQTGCLRLSAAPARRSLRQLATRAATEACCTRSLIFSGDKRGRLREILANIVNCIPLFQNFGSLQFSARTCAVELRCDGELDLPTSALRIQSARIALPDPGVCHVRWTIGYLKSIAQSFNAHQLRTGSAKSHQASFQRFYVISGGPSFGGW